MIWSAIQKYLPFFLVGANGVDTSVLWKTQATTEYSVRIIVTYLSIVKQVLSKICAPLYMGGRWNYRPICGSPRVNHIHFNADISDFDKKFAHKPRHF